MSDAERVRNRSLSLVLVAAFFCAACGTKPKNAGALEKAKERNNRAQSEMQGAFSP
jgi:hypothetical protein